MMKYPISSTIGPSNSIKKKYSIETPPTEPYFGLPIMRLCVQSVSASPRCQRVRCDRNTSIDSGACVQQTGAGTYSMRLSSFFSFMYRCKRTTSSISSPTSPSLYPPAWTTMFFWNRPNAPETINKMLKRLSPRRPNKNARKYSIICIKTIRCFGVRISTISPPSIVQPLTRKIEPHVATTSSSDSTIGFMTFNRASRSKIESASSEQKYG